MCFIFSGMTGKEFHLCGDAKKKDSFTKLAFLYCLSCSPNRHSCLSFVIPAFFLSFLRKQESRKQ
jgi:hypothetical protein